MARNCTVAMMDFQTEHDPVLYGLAVLRRSRKLRDEAEQMASTGDVEWMRKLYRKFTGDLECVSEHDLDQVCGLTPDELAPIERQLEALELAWSNAARALADLTTNRAQADGLSPRHSLSRVAFSKQLWR